MTAREPWGEKGQGQYGGYDVVVFGKTDGSSSIKLSSRRGSMWGASSPRLLLHKADTVLTPTSEAKKVLVTTLGNRHLIVAAVWFPSIPVDFGTEPGELV